jgi:hypothetical protein
MNKQYGWTSFMDILGLIYIIENRAEFEIHFSSIFNALYLIEKGRAIQTGYHDLQ